MDPELEEKINEAALGMVLWGEEEEAVLEKLKSNGIVGAPARKIYQKAWRTRLSLIRSDYWRQLRGGFIWILIGLITGYALLWGFWHGLGGSAVPLSAFVWIALAIGVWKSLNGLIGILFAGNKKGALG